jgi:hypothetical protein
MLSAELNISSEKFDWDMEIAQIGSAIRYHNENPPAGKVIVEVLKGLFGDEDTTDKVNNKEVKGHRKEKVIDIDQKIANGAYNNSAEDFMSLFGMAGGSV